jgi:hypothetical protein
MTSSQGFHPFVVKITSSSINGSSGSMLIPKTKIKLSNQELLINVLPRTPTSFPILEEQKSRTPHESRKSPPTMNPLRYTGTMPNPGDIEWNKARLHLKYYPMLNLLFMFGGPSTLV